MYKKELNMTHHTLKVLAGMFLLALSVTTVAQAADEAEVAAPAPTSEEVVATEPAAPEANN